MFLFIFRVISIIPLHSLNPFIIQIGNVRLSRFLCCLQSLQSPTSFLGHITSYPYSLRMTCKPFEFPSSGRCDGKHISWTCPPRPCTLSEGMMVFHMAGTLPPGLTFIFMMVRASFAKLLWQEELSKPNE